LMLCATAGFIVSIAIGSPGGYITAVLAAAVAAWSIRRAFRIRLAVDRNGVTVHNYWQTHRLTWAEVAGVGISLNGDPLRAGARLQPPNWRSGVRAGDPSAADRASKLPSSRLGVRASIGAVASRLRRCDWFGQSVFEPASALVAETAQHMRRAVGQCPGMSPEGDGQHVG
jgi:hypothetical protein